MTVEAPQRPPRQEEPELVSLIEALIEEARRRARRRRRRVAAGALLALAVVVGTLLGLQRLRGDAPSAVDGAPSAHAASPSARNGPLTVIAGLGGGIYEINRDGLGRQLFTCGNSRTQCYDLMSFAWAP